MPSVALLLRRARARVLSHRPIASNSAQRTRPRKSPPENPAMALPDDMLLEIFKRLPRPKDTIRCAAVCRRWRHVISSGARTGYLPSPPRHFGFFLYDRSSRMPPFVATKVGVNLDVGGFLPLRRDADILDGRGGVLVVREGSRYCKLRLILCNPLERSFRRLPTVETTGYQMACAAFVPLQGAGFRVAVVLFGGADDGLGQRYAVLVYDSASASSAWKMASASRRRGERHYNPYRGPSVVVGGVIYSLQEEHVMVVDTTNMTMSLLPPPVAHPHWLDGVHWIGKTDDGRPCYLAVHGSKLLHVERWALGADSKWTPQQPLRLPPDLHGMPLTTKHRSSFVKRLRFAGFCEGTSRMLFFVMYNWVVSFDIHTLEMERLWCCDADDEVWPCTPFVRAVYPYEMAWPPVLKDFVHSLSDQMQFGAK